ncbi:MAG: chemotaxis protein CheW [Candidatus Promineifilaceae bacterium]
MSDEAKKRPDVNKIDSADSSSADIPLPEEDDFALAALDFLSGASGSNPPEADESGSVNDFFDIGQLSSMAAMLGETNTSSKSSPAEDNKHPGNLDAGLMDLAESLTQGIPTSSSSFADSLLDLAESATTPVPDELPSSHDAALMDLAEGATGPVVDDLMALAASTTSAAISDDDTLLGLAEDMLANDMGTGQVGLPDLSDAEMDEETLIIQLAESAFHHESQSAELDTPSDEELLTLAAGDTSADEIPLPNLEEALFGLAESAEATIFSEALSALDETQTTSDALSQLETEQQDIEAVLARLQAQADSGADIDAELEALAALEAGDDSLDVDAALTALADEIDRKEVAQTETLLGIEPDGVEPTNISIDDALNLLASEAEIASIVKPIETSETAKSDVPSIEAALDLIEANEKSEEAIDVPSIDDLLGDSALDLLDEPVVDLEAPVDITTLAADALAAFDNAEETVHDIDSLLMEAGESALMAEDALSVLDGDSSAFAINPNQQEDKSGDAEENSGYLDMLVASIDAQLITTQRQETLLDLSGDDEDTKTVVEQLIVFSLGDSHYAIPIENVLEVGEPPTPTPVPFVPPWVRGVFNMRGDILSLVDLRTYFELDVKSEGAEEWMIISQTDREDMTVGLLVDDVIGNRQMSIHQAADLTSDIDGVFADYVVRLYRQDDNLISVLDFNKLLNSAEMRQFEHV